MGWKQIGNHRYFYRSRREGGRVVSEYFGRGEAGGLMAEILENDRADRNDRREAERAEREAGRREETAVAEWFRAVETVADGAMLAAGFRKHRGQWRRRRHGREGERDGGVAPREADVGRIPVPGQAE